jgi:uncharacterized protein YqgV (UPF0045/DUF77 family)
MWVTCQFSLYPLGDVDLGRELDKAIEAMEGTGLSYTVGNMSTYLEGEAGEVFAALEKAFAAIAREQRVVLTATLSNACPAKERGQCPVD